MGCFFACQNSYNIPLYFQDDIEKPRVKIDIPVLAAGGASTSSNEPKKLSKETTIQAIEAKLKSLESRNDDFVINKTISNELPIIQKYQFNKTNANENTGSSNKNMKYTSKSRYTSNPYNKRHKR